MGSKTNVWVFVLVIVVLPLSVFAIVQLLENKYKTLPVLGAKGRSIIDFHLTDQNGKSISTQNWKERIVVANFFFTHCPSICPRMTYNLKRIQAYAGVSNLIITSFTVDPERDSVAQLQQFAQKFDVGGNWHLVTGDKKELYKLARKGLNITATDGDGGPDDFIHSENLVLIDTQLRIRGYYDGTNESAIQKLIRDIQNLAGDN
ncbi:MAG TPA: SCO family protein [Chitinophagaceae bacterium]|nr:SCO family protein [Chitinophagaceae bacterium]